VCRAAFTGWVVNGSVWSNGSGPIRRRIRIQKIDSIVFHYVERELNRKKKLEVSENYEILA
jgi:hypothetical protein